MKFLVDEIPNSKDECPFHNYSCFPDNGSLRLIYRCRFDGGTCDLPETKPGCHRQGCKFLKTNMENYADGRYEFER